MVPAGDDFVIPRPEARIFANILSPQ